MYEAGVWFWLMMVLVLRNVCIFETISTEVLSWKVYEGKYIAKFSNIFYTYKHCTEGNLLLVFFTVPYATMLRLGINSF
jgi:hypothetical protein